MKLPRTRWIVAPLLLGAGLLLFVLRGGFGPDVPEPAPLEALPVSMLSVGLVYDLAALAEDLEAELPPHLGDLGSRLRYPGDERLAYAFEAERGPLELTAVGDTVRVATNLRYGGQVWYATPLGVELTTSCGIVDGELVGSAPRAQIELGFPLSVDETWTVRSRPSVDRVEPASASDRCRAAVLQFEVDATDAIMAGLRAWLEGEAGRIAARIEATSTRAYAEDWWSAAGSPIEVTSGVWLLLDPQAVSYRIGAGDGLGEPDETTSGRVTGEIAAAVQPRIVVGPRPTPTLRALPSLGAAPPTGTVAGSAWVTVEGLLDFTDVSELIGRGLEGAVWEGLGQTVRVASVAVPPESGGRAALDIELEGDHPARIRFAGTPVLDGDTGDLTVPDLDLTLEEGGTLPRALTWVARTFFLGVLRGNARWPVETLLPATLGQRLQIELSEAAALEVSLDAVELSTFATTEDGIVVRARARPTATLRIGPSTSPSP